MVGYFTDVSDQDKKVFRDFFFGNQDHFRCNVQKDVDVPLIPPTRERVFLPMAIQYPAAACDTMEDDPGVLLMGYWTTTATVELEEQNIPFMLAYPAARRGECARQVDSMIYQAR